LEAATHQPKLTASRAGRPRVCVIGAGSSEWVADILERKVGLPSRTAMQDVIRREDERMAKRYVRSPRHTIQVDFYPYMRTIRRERKRARGGLAGAIARRSHELRLGSPG
jgi:hypothetical protein